VGLTSQVVAIIENIAPAPDVLEQPLDVRDDRALRPREVLLRVGGAQRSGLLDREPLRDVAGQRIVCCGLVGDEVEVLSTACELWHEVRRIAEQADRECAPLAGSRAHPCQRVVQRIGRFVEVAGLEAPFDPGRVDLDAKDRSPRKRRRERLRAAHAAQACRQHGAPGKRRRAEVLLRRSREGLVGALQDALRPDVDPRAGGHLTEHRQARRLEPAELVPGRPLGDEQRVRDQDAGRLRRRPKDGDRLA
jgi:hypothetical protein